jgi:hypothetical protein
MLRALTMQMVGLGFWLAGAVLCAQEYKADKAGPPPAELGASVAQSLDPSGFAITVQGARYCEIWLRAELPESGAARQEKVTLPNIAPGTVVGAIRFDARAMDRHGQVIQPGVYILRYGIMPANIAHEGAAAGRDFLLLTQASEDRDLKTVSSPEELVALSRKASGTMHPAVLAVRKAASDSPGFSEQNGDWVLEARAGETAIAVIVAGSAGN